MAKSPFQCAIVLLHVKGTRRCMYTIVHPELIEIGEKSFVAGTFLPGTTYWTGGR